MIVGGYTLDLYCDSGKLHARTYSEGIGSTVNFMRFTGETRAECVAKARRAGWVFKRNTTVWCPRCGHHAGARDRGEENQ